VTTQKTRCPYCSSVFAVSNAQLAIRDGYTRCGKCFQVFKADDYLIQVRSTEPSDSKNSPANQTIEDQKKTSPIKSQGFNTELENFLDKATSQSQLPKEHIAKKTNINYDQKQKESVHLSVNPHSTPASRVPESQFVSAPISDRTPDRSHSLGKEFNEQWLNETTVATNDPHNQSSIPKTTTPTQNNLALKTIAPLTESTPRNIELTKVSAPIPERKAVKKDIPEVDDDLMGYLNKNSVAAASITKIKTDRVLPGMNDFHANQRSKKKDQTLPMHFNAQKRNVALDKLKERKPLFNINIIHTLGWLIVSLLMVVLLAAQYIFFNFDQLAANPRYQPMMHKACLQLGCDVPLIDFSKIKINKIIARHYPANPTGATIFTATMTNFAEESQPFPTIRLLVLKNKQVLSGRTLHPSDYLKSGSSSQLRIVPNHPIQIEFVVKISREAIPVFALDPVL
jgi:predicted Zn finger-like uncharacterized protein